MVDQEVRGPGVWFQCRFLIVFVLFTPCSAASEGSFFSFFLMRAQVSGRSQGHGYGSGT